MKKVDPTYCYLMENKQNMSIPVGYYHENVQFYVFLIFL
jgi:hypothetical protein